MELIFIHPSHTILPRLYTYCSPTYVTAAHSDHNSAYTPEARMPGNWDNDNNPKYRIQIPALPYNDLGIEGEA